MTNETIFRICAAVVLLAGAGISIYYRRKADQVSGERVPLKDEGTPMLLALRLGGLVMWLSVLAYPINPGWLAWSKLGLPDGLRWAAAGLGIVCVFLIHWLFRSIGTNISPTVATRSEHQLVMTGPYRWVRNPLYSVGTLFVLSLGTLADSWFIIAMAVLAFILLAMRLPNEEAHLIEKFGDAYREYMQKTGRFLPRLRP